MARPDKLPRVLTEEETDRLLAQPNQRYFGPHRDYLFMRLMLKAGLRASEATALRPEHIDLMSGKLSVREGKGAKDRTLWVGEEMLEELREWTGRRSEEVGNGEAGEEEAGSSEFPPDAERHGGGDLPSPPLGEAIRPER